MSNPNKLTTLDSDDARKLLRRIYYGYMKEMIPEGVGPGEDEPENLRVLHSEVKIWYNEFLSGTTDLGTIKKAMKERFDKIIIPENQRNSQRQSKKQKIESIDTNYLDTIPDFGRFLTALYYLMHNSHMEPLAPYNPTDISPRHW